MTFCVSDPQAPVTVILALPVFALEAFVRVIVEDPLPGAVMLSGLTVALMPEGNPDTEMTTLPLNPPLAALVILTLALAVALAITLPALALSANPGTFTVIVCFCVMPPPVAVMVAE